MSLRHPRQVLIRRLFLRWGGIFLRSATQLRQIKRLRLSFEMSDLGAIAAAEHGSSVEPPKVPTFRAIPPEPTPPVVCGLVKF
jgi:hypothetical protein